MSIACREMRISYPLDRNVSMSPELVPVVDRREQRTPKILAESTKAAQTPARRLACEWDAAAGTVKERTSAKDRTRLGLVEHLKYAVPRGEGRAGCDRCPAPARRADTARARRRVRSGPSARTCRDAERFRA